MAWSYLSPEHFVQAAESLAPYAERAATERNRALSSDLFGAIRDAGLFSLWVPKDFGGPEIPIRDFMLVVEASREPMPRSVGARPMPAPTACCPATFLAQSFERFGTTARPWWPGH
jgi:alkylation response protein AidB-like acyl-CoA dehydrogenase